MRMIQWRAPVVGRPTLVCLPGAMCPPEVFADAVREAGLPAVGLAWLEDPGSYELDDVAARVVAAIAPLGPVVLVGHSMGVPICVLAAVRDLDLGTGLVRGAVLSNSGANTRGHGDIEDVIARIEGSWGTALWDAFVLRCLGGPVSDELKESMRAYPARLSTESAAQSLRSQQRLDLLPVLPRLGSMPVAVVGGLRDPARTRAHAVELADAIPGSTLHLFDSGHTTCAEDPVGYAAVLQALAHRVSTLGPAS